MTMLFTFVLICFIAFPICAQEANPLSGKIPLPKSQSLTPMTIWDKLLVGISLSKAQKDDLHVLESNYQNKLLLLIDTSPGNSHKSDEVIQKLMADRVTHTRAILTSKQRSTFDRNLAPLHKNIYRKNMKLQVDSVQIILSKD